MKQKGQLLSLDFLLAIALVILGFGVIIKFSEMAVFEWQEQQEWLETETYGQNAVLLLLSNPQLTCEIKAWNDVNLGEHVNNCIDISPSHDINQAALGLPDDWNYNIFNRTDGSLIRGTRDPSDSSPRIFSVDINAIVFSGKIPKNVLYKCLKKKNWEGTPYACPLAEKQVWVRIWKK